ARSEGVPSAATLPPSGPCYQPAVLTQGGRLWGLAVQLYSLRSSSNWGIGDFGDLHDLIRLVAPLGAAFVGVTPLHALPLAHPDQASPYSGSNRHALNPLYVAVPRVPEFAESAEAARLVAAESFTRRLDACRASAWVDYRAVSQLKLEALRCLYRHFAGEHLA